METSAVEPTVAELAEDAAAHVLPRLFVDPLPGELVQ
jgi:hypothetical protein